MTACLFLVDNEFGSLFARVALRILSSQFVTVTSFAGLDGQIATKHFDLIMWPMAETMPLDRLVEIDRKARSNGAMCLPVELVKNRLCIGPLLGPERSCAFCWMIRKQRIRDSHKPEHMIPDLIADTALEPSQSLASLAFSATLYLLTLAADTSPYILYDVSSRHLRSGYLTATQECQVCRERLLNKRQGNKLLQDLVQNATDVRKAGYPAS